MTQIPRTGLTFPGGRKVYQTDSGEFAISERGLWRPGCFQTLEAAKKAFKLSDMVLQMLQKEALALDPIWGKITLEQVQSASRGRIKKRGVIKVPPAVIAAAEKIKLQNYKTNTPAQFQIHPLHDQSAELMMQNLADILDINRARLDYVYFSVCKGAEEHVDMLDANIFENRTFVIPVILPTGRSIIQAEQQKRTAELFTVYEFNHERPHAMYLEDTNSGCVVIMVAVKKEQ